MIAIEAAKNSARNFISDGIKETILNILKKKPFHTRPLRRVV